MLRIVHTADWHIGQSLRGFSRDAEHRAVFAELTALVAEREVDALIVAGDVFDSQNPGGEAQRLFFDLLAGLHRARPTMTTVITAGNHDAAGRLEAPGALLERFRVHVIGNVARREGKIDIRRHLIPLADAWGEIAAHALALSYPTAACLPPFSSSDATGSPIVRAVSELYGELFESAAPLRAGLPLIATGHLHVAGGVESEGAERRILIGGEHAVPAGMFQGRDAAYVALGHLHRAQDLGAGVRYSGSLFPLSATEHAYRHGVTLVTLKGAETRIEHIPLTRPVPFLRLPEHGALRLDELSDRLAALDLDPALPTDKQPFLAIRLAPEGLAAGFRAEVDRIVESVPVRLVDARLAVSAESEPMADTVAPLVRLAERDPEDMFRRAFEKRYGRPPEPAHLDAFHHLRADL
ncbi:exonuclease SbcCD subunit D [Methylocapsa acidiphila]|uniref:exonuclease SbcCD subunit D n=1 Tax=Methylocapsa acidiphila TaxID=133552 RepID=UPI00041A61A6|nr:exonuclease SbcCD subunit D [Methylocapsa acidiphila]